MMSPWAKVLILMGALCFASVAPRPAASGETLYDELGGRENIIKFTNELIDISLVDDRIKETFDNVNIERLRQHIADQLCQLSGGPCKYTGRDMKKSHVPLHITDAQFNALAEDLQIAMDHARVPYRAQNKLLAILAPMERDIVTK